MSECPYIVNQECDIAKCEEFHIRADERKKAEQDFQNSDYWNEYLEKVIADAKAEERINTVQFIIGEFNRRTVCLGRATAKNYVINTLNEILKEVKGQKFRC